MTALVDAPVLQTERLRLRAPELADFERQAAFYQTDRSRFVGGPLSRGSAWRFFATNLGHWILRGYGFWSLEEKATGAYLGGVALWNPEGWPEAEIGWTVMPEAEGRGVAFEAAVALRRHAYQTLGWSTVISLIDHANTRSEALARRLGARFEREVDVTDHGVVRLFRHPSPAALFEGAAA